MFDVAIIGGGPAALAAGIYAARAGKRTILFEKAAIGGLTAETAHIENYPGYIGTGANLIAQMRSQVEQSGAELKYGNCTKLSRQEDGIINLQIDNNQIQARTAIIASGNDPKPLNIPGEDTANISRCATCDAALYNGKIVAVVGGGDSAVQEAIHIANLAAKVIIIARSQIRARPELIARVQQEATNITMLPETTVKEIARLNSDTQIMHLRYADGREEFLQVHGIFAYIGYVPASRFLADSGVNLDEQGYVVTAVDQSTSVQGVFAAGDITTDPIKQIITAAAGGARAALSALHYINQLG